MLEILFYSYITSIFLFSAGIFFSRKVINFDFNGETNLFQIGLYGAIFLSFIALFINFFFDLNKIINTLILFLFFIYLIFYKREMIKKILLSSILVSLICSLIIIFDTTYRPDAGLYHLPYTNILNNEKIIIGLSNIHFRYGHTSIIQYLSALNNNYIFGDKGVIIPLSSIFSFFLLYLIKEIKIENDKFIIFFNFIILSFLCLKLNRYSDFGNDAPAHIFYFFLISIALKYYNRIDKSKMGELLTVTAYIIFSKVTLFLGSLIPISIIILKKKINFFNLKILFFLVLFLVSFFTKNLLVSGCFAFPIEKTCVKKIFWYDKDSKRGSNAKVTMLENEAWTKGWSDQRKNRKNFEEYLSNYNWIKLWSKNHGIRTLNKLTPFLIFLLVIILSIHRLTKNNILDPNNFIKKSVLLTFLTINIFGSLMWFFKFPVFRYGSSYLISSIAIILIIICYKKVLFIDTSKFRKVLFNFTVFLLIVLISKNSLRIFKNYNEVYNHSPWPKIYSEDEYNLKKMDKPIIKDTKIIFFQSTGTICYYNSSPCTHMLNSQFDIDEINLTKILGYKMYFFNRGL